VQCSTAWAYLSQLIPQYNEKVSGSHPDALSQMMKHEKIGDRCAERKLLNVPIPKHMAKSLLL
jgi:hypothetical protein